jgi:xylulokinase
MLLLGIDIGTSSVKVSVVDAQAQQCIASATFPETEAEIIALQPGWAEQSPDQWWEHVKQAILKCHANGAYNPHDIGAIGIAYQMHGLVLVDKEQHVLRNAIIWCDSRAVNIGNNAFVNIGEQKCLSHLLNSPGNFTASKLAWVKENEPSLFERIDKIMLPGDFIAMKMTGSTTTTISALSEGIFWDFKENKISSDILSYFGFNHTLFPECTPVFTPHGYLKETVAERLSLKAGIPLSYKAGDQPNNALSLNVLRPGEVAATAGTSGVIYGVSNKLEYDDQSRINSFAHVNHTLSERSIGVLLCINGAGIFNRWVKNFAGINYTYQGLNDQASKIKAGANGLLALPFGNGAERMLNNAIIGAHFLHLDFNTHTTAHMVRAVQEGIAFAFRYGLDIMRENGINPSVVRAGKANMFLSNVFTQAFAGVNNIAVEFFDGDGSYGAAIGAGVGAGVYTNIEGAFSNRKPNAVIAPAMVNEYNELYEKWKLELQNRLLISQNKELEALTNEV